MSDLVAGVPWRSAGVLLLLALLPGAYAWWTGRRLVRLRDDAALPERLQARGTRLAQLVGVAFAVTAILWPSSLLWAVPLLWLGLGVGSFPARRALFEERWTLAEYLLARLRLVAAWPGPLLLLAAAPALVVEGPFSVPGWVLHADVGPDGRVAAATNRDELVLVDLAAARATRVAGLAGTGAPLGLSPRGDRLFALAAVGERTLVRVIDLR